MRNMTYDCVREVLIVVHTDVDPLDSEWDDWMKRMAMLDYKAVLILTDGGAPTPRQRSLTNKFWAGKHKPKMAVISDSPIVRGAIFAFYWLFKGGMRPFSPTHVVDALLFLEVADDNYEAVQIAAQSMQRALRAEHQLKVGVA